MSAEHVTQMVMNEFSDEKDELINDSDFDECGEADDEPLSTSDLSLKLINLNPEADDVNTLSDEFVKIFNDTLDTHAPYPYASRKEQRSFNKPWLTKGILTSIAKKNTLYRKQLTTNNQILLENTKLTEMSLPT